MRLPAFCLQIKKLSTFSFNISSYLQFKFFIMKFCLYLTSIFLLLSAFSCKKKSSAGFGGNATLNVTGQHHGVTIDSLTVYIKFNTSEAPADATYDAHFTVTHFGPQNSYAIINNLKAGNYYLYAEGWDPSISNSVKGGIPYTIENETTYSVTVPVTEQH